MSKELSEKTYELHNAAMSYVDEAFFAKRKNDTEGEQKALRLALQKEREAAELLTYHLDLEPTRGILFRSAATIALNLKEFKEAKRLAEKGKAGKPIPCILQELEEVIELAKAEKGFDSP